MQGQTQTRGTRPTSAPEATPRTLGVGAAALLVVGLSLEPRRCGGSGITQSFQRGYVLPEGALEQIPLGSSQEQVLIVLGTPSTVATISGEAFYYISQRTEQTSFLPQQEVSRRIIAMYFDKGRKVQRIADYGDARRQGLRRGQPYDAFGRRGTELHPLHDARGAA